MHRFKPGQSGNPKGRPPGPPKHIKKLAKLTHEDLVTMTSELWFSDISDLHAIVKQAASAMGNKTDSGPTGLQAGRAVIASVMLTAIAKGDHKKMDSLLNRVVGRPAETLKLIGINQSRDDHSVPAEALLSDPKMASQALILAEFAAKKAMEGVAPIPETAPIEADFEEVDDD